MPKNLIPEDRWENDFQVPIPGEPRRIGPLETLFQRLLNRTERLKNRIADILGTAWDATPPDTLAGLAERVGTLENDAYLSRGSVSSAVDWNTLTDAGTYEIAAGAFGTGSANTPPAVTQQGHLLVLKTLGATTQVYVPKGNDPGIYWRQHAGGTWSPWAATGAMYDTNSNGSYIRFADGTQICWASHDPISFGYMLTGDDTNYKYKFKTWVFPAAFITAPVATAGGDVEGSRVDVINVFGINTTQCTLEAGQYNTSAVNVSAFYTLAIGRWK
jgi:hypothetical protein